MALETVRVHVVDTETPPGDIANVTVRYFTTLEVFVTSAVTNASGIADVTLNGDGTGIDYHARFFKDTVSFTSPQVISVYSPAAAAPNGTNDFEVEGDIHAATAPASADLCRCFGYFRNVAGIVPNFLEIRFQTLYDPMIVNGVGVYPSPVYAETDADGYMSIDLYRGSNVMVSLAAEHIQTETGGHLRDIVVPDRSTCNLLDLLFPVVIDISWSPAAPFNVAVGGTLDIVPTVTATNFQVLVGTALEDVTYSIADETVATVSLQSDKLVLTGVKSGSTTITGTRKDETIVRVPDTISGVPATISVA